MTLHSTLSIHLDEEVLAEDLLRAITPELTTMKSRGSKASMRVEGSDVVLQIEAPTVASLRALLNSYIRWVSTSLDIVSLKGD